MKKKSIFMFAVFAGIFLGSITIKAGIEIFSKPLSPRIANYDITVKLDPKTRILHGEELLVWHNKTNKPAKDLHFHLYLNAFRNSESTWLKYRGGKKIKKLEHKDGWGYIEIEKIEILGGKDITKKIEFIQPDDDNEHDMTVMSVPLDTPIMPGQSITVKIKFRSRLPQPAVARTGAKKDYFFVAQWFPKIGVLEKGKWNCHQFHSTTEFYADYGVYNVKIQVPEDYVVGATGIEVEKKKIGAGQTEHFYRAEDVHDFAWTACPKFVEFKGRSQDVDIRVLMHKSHKSQGERHLTAAKLAVEHFQNRYGDYPYPNLTVVDPAPGAFATGGMEYPTLITAGTLTGLPRNVRAVEMVIIHEFGHNYWYHLVGSNEFEEAWLDEGINTYSEIRIMHDIYGPKISGAKLLGFKVDDMQMRRYSYVTAADLDQIDTNAWEFYNHASYRSNAYSKPALALLTIENLIGEEKMGEIMRTYFERYKFKHPHTKDFIDVFNEVAGKNYDWYFDQVLYSNAVLDYSVDFVSSKEITPGKGFDYTYDVSTGDKLKTINKYQDKIFETTVKIRRLGEFKFPVEILIEFEDGETVLESWDGQSYWKEFTYTRPSKLKIAKIDPNKKIPLDLNWTNNSKTPKQQKYEKEAGMLDMIKFVLKPE